jgi:hypothetical protein
VPNIQGLKKDYLNVAVTTSNLSAFGDAQTGSAGGFDAMVLPTARIDTGTGSDNTFEHETGHPLLGHNLLGKDMGAIQRFFLNFELDREVNTRLDSQARGNMQMDFRTGLAKKQYSAPVNPEANKPK